MSKHKTQVQNMHMQCTYTASPQTWEKMLQILSVIILLWFACTCICIIIQHCEITMYLVSRGFQFVLGVEWQERRASSASHPPHHHHRHHCHTPPPHTPHCGRSFPHEAPPWSPTHLQGSTLGTACRRNNKLIS